jgi:hypothetical protein
MSANVIDGRLYKAKKRSSALTTNPWELSDRTITFLDHKTIEKNDIALLIEFSKTENIVDNMSDDVGIFVFIFEDKIIWQVMNCENFDKCWEMIQ